MGEQPLCPPFSKAGDTCLHNPSLLPYLSCGGGGGGDWRRTQSRNAEHCWLKGCMQNQAELSGSGSLSPGVGSHAFCQTIKKKKKKKVSESRIVALRGRAQYYRNTGRNWTATRAWRDSTGTLYHSTQLWKLKVLANIMASAAGILGD